LKPVVFISPDIIPASPSSFPTVIDLNSISVTGTFAPTGKGKGKGSKKTSKSKKSGKGTKGPKSSKKGSKGTKGPKSSKKSSSKSGSGKAFMAEGGIMSGLLNISSYNETNMFH